MAQLPTGQPETPDAAPSAPARARPWSAFESRDFRSLWASNALVSTATFMRQVVNLWQVYQLSGSTVQLGLTGLFQAVPYLTLSLVAGNVADAVDRRKLLLSLLGLNCLLALVLAFLTATGQIAVWHIYVITSATSALGVFMGPARQSLIPKVVPQAHLLNAMTLNTTVLRVSMLGGPFAGGIFLGLGGAALAYPVDAVLVGASAITLAFVHIPGPARGRAPVGPAAMLEGLRFFLRTRALLALALLDLGATMLGAYVVLLPVFSTDILHVGEVGFGMLSGAPAIGALAGAMGLLLFGSVRRQGLMVIASTLVFSMALVGLGLSGSFPLTLGIIALLGFCDSIGTVVRHAAVQMLPPDHMRGRATSVLFMFSMGGPSLGAAISGVTASRLGAGGAMVLAGAMVAGVTVALAMLFGSLRRFRA